MSHTRGGAPGPSSTPSHPNVSVHASASTTLLSTPNSRGASVVSSQLGLLGVTVKKVFPWIERDIELSQTCLVDDMLRVFLQRASDNPDTEQPDLLATCLENVVRVLSATPSAGDFHPSRIKEYLAEYASHQVETDSYAPFVKASNVALKCLERVDIEGMPAKHSDLDIVCQVNDHPILQDHQGRTSQRKPDVLILPCKRALQTLSEGHRDMKADEYRLTGAAAKPESRLSWEDVLACIEFKRPTKKLPNPPPSYEVKEYTPTDPEFRCVEPSVPEAPETAAASSGQTPAQSPACEPEPVRRSARKATQDASNNSSKRKADAALQSASKRAKTEDETEPEPKLDVIVQTGLYAAEMFASNVAVKHLINLVIVGDVVWIWYYDRQGSIQCSGFNFIQDFPRFMALLYAFQRFSPAGWGRNPDFNRDEKSDSHKVIIGDVDLELHTSDKDRVTHYGLKGRATNVFPVTSEKLAKDHPQIAKDGMMAKVFWGEEQRTSEPDILKKVYEVAEEHEAVKGHVPYLLWHHKFENPTSEIREALGVSEPKKGSRVLYILVFRKLRPITDLQGADFFEVWQQCISCHYALWQAGVLHRDVSPGNLMWYWGEDNTLMGVLNDYDLSSLATVQGPEGNERTGTVPFMAIDLLTGQGQRGEVKHLYRHDLESFMWVLVWVTCRYKGGRLLPRKSRHFDQWATVTAEDCGKEKVFFLSQLLKYEFSNMDPRMADLVVDCCQALKREGDRRQELKFQQRRGQVVTEEMELDDAKFLNLFTSATSWVQLKDSLS